MDAVDVEGFVKCFGKNFFSELPLLSPRETERVTREREDLMEECFSKGARYHSGNRAKMFTGKMSPGCESCVAGTFACLILRKGCTRRCFFCPWDQDRTQPDHESIGVKIDSPADLPSFIRAFGYKHVGVTGGEPLLVFEKLRDYIDAIRRGLGDDTWIWTYTNGDLVDREKLRALADAGLNELRFDLGARNYDLAPLKTALSYIGTVTVETPVIPEHVETLKALLPELSRLGVKYLNIHQLHYTAVNSAAFVKRKYTALLHNPPLPLVLESERAALQVMKHALDSGVDLPINYCSGIYIRRFRPWTHRKRLADALRNGHGLRAPFETVTETGYVRRLYVRGRRAPLLRFAKSHPDSAEPCPSGNDGAGAVRLGIHPALVDLPALNKWTVTAAYSDLRLGTKHAKEALNGVYAVDVEGAGVEIEIRGGRERSLFRRLFVGERFPEGRAAGRSPARFKERFRDLEYLPIDLPDCF